MASEKGAKVENQKTREEIVSVELPAPDGWKKKFTPKKGGTPRRNEITFISPTGEEIKNKRELDRYLKSHPEGPSPSEFDWGTGDTPRRSVRLSGKSKATDTPEREPPKKRGRKSSSKEEVVEIKDHDGENEAGEKKAAAAVTTEETKASADVEMKEGDNIGKKNKEESTLGENLAVKETGTEEFAQVTGEKIDDNDEKPENLETDDIEVSDMDILTENSVPQPEAKEHKEKIEEQPALTENSVQQPGAEEHKEKIEEQLAWSHMPTPSSVPGKGVSSENVAKEVEEFPVKEVNVATEPASEKETKVKATSSERTKMAEDSSTCPDKEIKVVEEAASDKEIMAKETSSWDAKVGEENSSNTEVKVGGEIAAKGPLDNGSLKEIQEETTPMESNSIKCEDAQHQPKASPVSC